MTYDQLNARLIEVTSLAMGLAQIVADNTCGEEDPEFDMSHGWAERHDDYDYAKKMRQRLAPTLAAAQRRQERAARPASARNTTSPSHTKTE